MEINTFRDFTISAQVMKSLDKMGYATPTPVQRIAIEPMMAGKDIVVQAPTGTGKTAAFGIPVVEGINPSDNSVQTLILCPTRELAMQTTDVLHQLTLYKPGVKVLAIYGGVPIGRQIMALKKRPQIIVATPGRMKDHMNRRTIRLDRIKVVVLDEADLMLDMGFRPDLQAILGNTPKDRQTVMFSATMAPEILDIAKRYQKEINQLRIEQKQRTADTVTQYFSKMQGSKKEATLVTLLRDQDYGISLVFVSRKHMADKLAKTLIANKINAAALHGDMSQNKRDAVMRRYRNGDIDVLVATDVAARGLDIDNIDVVVNFDLPQDINSYIHRIGRTGRAEETGVAYTFVTDTEHGKFKSMIRRTNTEVPMVRLRYADDFVSRTQRAI
jgi:ATP-dependent RNA helicase DeaD